MTFKNIKVFIIKYIKRHISKFSKDKRIRIANLFLPDEMRNINLDLANPDQKRAMICYLPIHKVDIKDVPHASFQHINQMIHYFVQHDYCVDVCSVDNDFDLNDYKNNVYEVLIGFGSPFKQMAKSLDIPIKISFIMENNPDVVSEKYEERTTYFHERHPGFALNDNIERKGYFDVEQFHLADYGIHMSSKYNAKSLEPYFSKIWTINANAILNNIYRFDEEKLRAIIPSSKNRILWFGSTGLIHKGVDILLDAMDYLPECTCDFYGINEKERFLFDKLKKANTFDRGRISVQSQDFIDNIVLKHCFMVLPSCSEGMSTAVCTCMAAGIIPIVSKESGFDPHPAVTILEDYSVECLVKTISELLMLTDDEILHRRRIAYDYAREAFSLKHFDSQFSEIMNNIKIDFYNK